MKLSFIGAFSIGFSTAAFIGWKVGMIKITVREA